ncbi:MAG: flagellar brake protein [Gammaproteobacteria bacterium]|nr:flagellar brake protein [Gammaproteobacteria bacterium]
MAKEQLPLDIGDILQLQFLPNESDIRHYVKVIGYLQEKSLIITTPHIHGKFMLVREGQPAAVRVMSGNQVMAFTANVLRSSVKPYPYLHLSYPREMQAVTVRKAQRVNLRIPAVVSDCSPGAESADQPSEPVAVDVEDMSTLGALLISPHQLGDVKTLLSITMLLNVVEAEEELALVAVIRNVRPRENPDTGKQEYLHGIEFQFADRQESILLHAYVYEKIICHPSE